MSLGLAPVLVYQLFTTLEDAEGGGAHHPAGRAERSSRFGRERLRLRHRRGPRLHRRSARRARSKAGNPARLSRAYKPAGQDHASRVHGLRLRAGLGEDRPVERGLSARAVRRSSRPEAASPSASGRQAALDQHVIDVGDQFASREAHFVRVEHHACWTPPAPVPRRLRDLPTGLGDQPAAVLVMIGQLLDARLSIVERHAVAGRHDDVIGRRRGQAGQRGPGTVASEFLIGSTAQTLTSARSCLAP